MAVANYPAIQPYVKGKPGSLPGAEMLYIESELKKIMKTLADLIDVVTKIESKVTYP